MVPTTDSPGESDAAPARDRLRLLLASLGGTDPAVASSARDELVSLAMLRMRALASRVLTGSARVRRWEETDDLIQGAMFRLHRALESVAPRDGEHFLRLAALQVRRELVDLARRHRSPNSFAANYETNSLPSDSNEQRVDGVVDPGLDAVGRLAEWTRFHELAASLPEEDRRLFDMVWYLGMTQQEIADSIGCSERTVRRRWEETKRRFITGFNGKMPE